MPNAAVLLSHVDKLLFDVLVFLHDQCCILTRVAEQTHSCDLVIIDRKGRQFDCLQTSLPFLDLLHCDLRRWFAFLRFHRNNIGYLEKVASCVSSELTYY